MGVVFEAYDHELGTNIALKTLQLRPSGDNVYRFKREFRSLRDLRHPNLIHLHELFEDQGLWFFTMELVEGVDFLEWVRPSSAPWTDIGSEKSMPPGVSPLSLEGAGSDGAMIDAGTGDLASGSVGDVDLPRLNKALEQLARGLNRLHTAHKVHRDIKPSNLLVTHDGRLVLLDFGLVAELDTPTQGKVVGTPAYMAPEQAAQRAVGPAADWYSVGVLLFQALTTRLPFEGAPLHVLLVKQSHEPPSPANYFPGIPPELDRLCQALLAVNPEQRPDGGRVLSLLGAEDTLEPARRQAEQEKLFVGRSAELDSLSRAFDTARHQRRAVTYVLYGDSGVGKSALVRHFTGNTAAHAVALFGRCFEHESVPYKAFDGVIDVLSDYMAELPPAGAAALVPRDASLLLKAFPVLARVPALCDAPSIQDDGIHPQEQRKRVFEALRELLGRVAARVPVVIAIDDLQWADRDSLALIETLMAGPDAPPILLIATARTSTDVSIVRELEDRLAERVELRRRHLDPLLLEDARLLAQGLLGEHGEEIERAAAAIAEEANGHPLFIETLARHAAAGENPTHPVRLDAALATRIENLDSDSRAVLELVAVAGKPRALNLLATAADVGMAELREAIEVLRAERLVGTGGSRRVDEVEPYHDRVRQAALDLVGDERSARHRQLATALEQSENLDAEALYMHWRGANETTRAAGYAEIAGDEASAALAFDRAIGLYEASIRDAPAEREAELHGKLAAVLASAGRSSESADFYERASDLAEAGDRAAYQRAAADQYLRSGHIDRGVAAMSPFLAESGLKMPRSAGAALRSYLLQKLVLRIRRPHLGFRVRPEEQISAPLLEQMDVCWSTAIGLYTVDQLRGLHFHARHLALALSSGEPSRVARALAMEAVSYAATGAAREKTEKLLARARALAEPLASPYLNAHAHLATGVAAYLRGEWQFAVEQFNRAEEIFCGECSGVAWELDCIALSRRWALAYLGRLPELCRMVDQDRAAAEARGDLYGVVNTCTGLPNLVWLIRNQPAEARAVSRSAIAKWSQAGFHLQHLCDLFAQCQADLYEGDGERALRRLDDNWRKVTRAGLLQVEINRVFMFDLRARAAIAAAGACPESRRQLLSRAGADARRVRSVKRPWAVGLSRLLEAQIALLWERNDDARRAVEDAIAALDQAEMRLHSAAASTLAENIGVARPDAISWRVVSGEAGIVSPGQYLSLVAPAAEYSAEGRIARGSDPPQPKMPALPADYIRDSSAQRQGRWRPGMGDAEQHDPRLSTDKPE